MKTLLIGLLALGSLSVFAGSTDQTARLLNATCNSRYGIGEVQFAIYDKNTNSFTMTKLNVVNDSLCGVNSSGRPSKLIDMSMSSILGGESVNLHNIRINTFGVVTDIEELNADKGPWNKLYNKFNLLKMYSYQQSDLRLVDLDLVFTDDDTIERIPLLIDMAKLD